MCCCMSSMMSIQLADSGEKGNRGLQCQAALWLHSFAVTPSLVTPASARASLKASSSVVIRLGVC